VRDACSARLVYNKGAMVLHMLRRTLGDDKFFEGLRQFYTTWKFRKAGTDDFRRMMEKVSGQDLTSFFDGWIYGSAVPEIGFTSTLTSSDARIRFDHRGTVIPTRSPSRFCMRTARSRDVVIVVNDRTVERTLPLKGPVRSIEANRDYAAVAEIGK
jgi:aminopeptidase N